MEGKVGRPTVMTEEKIKELESYFIKGLNDEEVCLMGDINTSTLYKYCSENPEFAERKELLKHKPKTQAKINIESEINRGDKDISKWYLERRDKDFKDKKQIDEVSEQNVTYRWANENDNDSVQAVQSPGELPQEQEEVVNRDSTQEIREVPRH